MMFDMSLLRKSVVCIGAILRFGLFLIMCICVPLVIQMPEEVLLELEWQANAKAQHPRQVAHLPITPILGPLAPLTSGTCTRSHKSPHRYKHIILKIGLI